MVLVVESARKSAFSSGRYFCAFSKLPRPLLALPSSSSPPRPPSLQSVAVEPHSFASALADAAATAATRSVRGGGGARTQSPFRKARALTR